MRSLRISGDGVVTIGGFPYVDAEGPRGMNDLRVFVHEAGYLVSFWEPTAEERAQIAAGKPIMLWVMGRAQPPVSLCVSDVAVPEDVAK